MTDHDLPVLRFGHSPDPDDAFMFYGFSTGAVTVEGPGAAGEGRRYRVEHLLEDIQSLNERAMGGELEITAISAHAYPYVADKYVVMRTGVSMGDGYGPLIVTRKEASLESLRGARIAIPGLMTTASLALKFHLDAYKPVVTPFDQILESVRDGKVDAGVVIHEGQLTFDRDGLYKVADLGQLWKQETGLPLPLGLDVVRRDLGADLGVACSRALRASIEYAMANREAAMRYALDYGRGLDMPLGDRFVGMYVNDWTLDMGEKGRLALTTLLDRAADQGWVPRLNEDLMLV
ncbi:MAG: ABC transporter substrate-binding protein [Candidatus Eisenbacteria bacterium]|nr:ABC transporter substrate-binding protein [Candidatus Eisenbacteria bacterium]